MKLIINALMVCFMLQVAISEAQVGFNTPTPDPSSVVDVSSTNKGFLIPRMTSAQRAAMSIASPAPTQGLMVFDTDVNRIYFWDGSVTAWRPVNFADVKEYSGNEVVHVKTQMTVGSGYTNTAAPNNGLIVQGNTGMGTSAPVAGNKLHVHGNVLIDSNLQARSISLSNTTGNGIVPPGIIVMWSGTVPPAGWALCNGTNETPDLRGRFIVGYNPLVADYDQPGNRSTGGTTNGKTAGEASVTLTTAQIPAHNHTGTTSQAGAHFHTYGEQVGWAEAGGSYWSNLMRRGDGFTNRNTSTTPDHSHTLNINNTGGGQAHENRPPYYVLAYIIKL